MKKIQEYVLAFVSSKNSYESMRYGNKLMVSSIVPLLVFASVINIILFMLLSSMDLTDMFLNSAVELLFGAAFILVDRFVKSEYRKYDIYNVVFCAIIIFTVLRYYTYSGPAVWTIAFVFILLSILRNNVRMIAAVSVTVFALGVYVWVAKLHYNDGLQYVVTQFVVFTVVFIVSAGILRINLERFKKTSHFVNETEMVSRISSDLITVSPENLEYKICGMLEKTSRYYGVERAIIFLLSKADTQVCLSFEWVADGYLSNKGRVKDFDIQGKPVWADQIENKTVWIIPNVDDPKIADIDHIKTLRDINIKAMISAPIMVKNKVYGILIYESLSKYRNWKSEHRKLLVVLTNLLGDTFTKVEAENNINYMAYYDALTGLPNRFNFNLRLDKAIEAAQEYHTNLAVMFIDLDSFKSVNDAIGHEGGDELLRIVGTNLNDHLGAKGIVGRQGGDEFIICIPDIGTSEHIKEFAKNVMTVFSKPVTIENQEFFVTASAGIAIYPYDGEDSNTLKRNADLAMYAAKELGKNQVTICTPKLKEDIEKKVRITNLLHRALEKDEFVVYYQPLVDIATKEIVGVEALLRWIQPELGMIPPAVFIPLAEQTGLIYPIGKWVLREACRQNKAWQEAGVRPIRMAVNVSIEQFRRGDIVDMLKEVLGETGLDPHFLELEITESVTIKEMDYICVILESIRQLGVTISIDDFGTEYSSLARIKRLPVDRIKMAMEFVHGITISEKDEAIVKIIINLANNLGLKVIAEGVETEAQFEFLQHRICNEVQGYYFYKPMPVEEVEKILKYDEGENELVAASR